MPPPSSGLPRSLLPAPRSRHLAFLTSDLRPLTVLLLVISSFFILPSAFPAAPPWWTTRGVLDPNATPDDYAPVNAGQLKNMAKALYDEIEFRVPGGPSPALYSHMEALAATPDDYVVINIGQLKNVVKPFYDFLAPFGGPAVPWPAPGLTADNYAPANLGQLKNVFAQLDPASLLAAPAMSDDSDGDGLTNAEEMVVGTDPYTPDTVIHGEGTIVTRGIGVWRDKRGTLGFLGQQLYLREDFVDGYTLDVTSVIAGVPTRTQWSWSETSHWEFDVDGYPLSANRSFHEVGTVSANGVTIMHTDVAWPDDEMIPQWVTSGLGVTMNIESDSTRTHELCESRIEEGYNGGGSSTLSKIYDDGMLFRLSNNDLRSRTFAQMLTEPAVWYYTAGLDWGMDYWFWRPDDGIYVWFHDEGLPDDTEADPCPYASNSALRFQYDTLPPYNAVAQRKMQFALKVDNPVAGRVYVKSGILVWHPQSDLGGTGTVVGQVRMLAKGESGGLPVYSKVWSKEPRTGFGRLDLVETGSYLNFNDVAEQNENLAGGKVIPVGGTATILAGVGCSETAQSLRTKFHLRQGDPAHATVQRVGPPLTPVAWDDPFDPGMYSGNEYRFSSDTPGVYVIEQITTATINGEVVEVDREGVTVSVVDFTKLQISSADIPPRAIEDTTLSDEPRTAANTLYLCEDPTGFTTLNIQGWWEPESTGNAECKWVIQEINDSSGTPSGRWESGYGTFSANPAVSIFNGNTPGTVREFKVTGWYDCNSDNVPDPGEAPRRLFVAILNVDIDVDTDRNGLVEDSVDDEVGEESWEFEKGAIYNVNFDSDGSCKVGSEFRPDAIHFADDGSAVDENYVIDNADDEKDIAPLIIRKIATELPAGCKVYLKVAEQEDIQRIHVYKKIEANAANTAIWGTMTGAPPATELDITQWVDPNNLNFQGDPVTGDATFGIEGLCFRNQGGSVIASQEFDGYIDLTLELRNGAMVLSSDAVRLKVAPWIMLSSDQASEEVWALKVAGTPNDEFLFTHSADPGYKGLDDSGQLQTAPADAQWFQDNIEIGFTQRPGGPKTHVVFMLPYGATPKWPLEKLLKKDIGVFQMGSDIRVFAAVEYFPGAFGGNLEVLPPDGTSKLGRIVLGDSDKAPSRLKDFLSSQEVQSPKFDVPTGWLAVAHIDEITAFLAASDVAIADPTMAWNLLTGIPVADRGKSVFFATGAQPFAGVASANSSANMRIETGINHTGQSWGYIRVYAGKEAGTVGEIHTRGNGFITVSRVWNTTSKIINGVAPDYDIYHWADHGPAPPQANWRPQAGDKFVLCEGTRYWKTLTPAIVTVEEVLADADFENANKVKIQALIDQAEAKLHAASGTLSFKKVPNLFFARLDGVGDVEGHSGLAFNPGPTNLQPLNGKLYVPRQFSPLNAAGEDVYEESIKAALGGTVEFVDCWDLYHRLMGEVHCGSNVKRAPLGVNWWENQP